MQKFKFKVTLQTEPKFEIEVELPIEFKEKAKKIVVNDTYMSGTHADLVQEIRKEIENILRLMPARPKGLEFALKPVESNYDITFPMALSLVQTLREIIQGKSITGKIYQQDKTHPPVSIVEVLTKQTVSNVPKPEPKLSPKVEIKPEPKVEEKIESTKLEPEPETESDEGLFEMEAEKSESIEEEKQVEEEIDKRKPWEKNKGKHGR